MKRLLIVTIVALGIAVPAASASTTTFRLRAGGIVQDRNMNMSQAAFGVNFKKGPGHKVTYVDSTSGITFRSLSLSSVKLVRNAVKITGIGLANGRRVHFAAIAAAHNTTAGDWFTIAWDHMASHGGKVVSGNIRITPVSTTG
jgi:hypothetical protein